MTTVIEDRQLRVYCPTHKINFEVPEASRILCEGGGHALAQDFPHGDFWEYCCDCQVFRPSEMDKGGKAKEQCPVCSRATARRYVCDECKVVSYETDDPARRKLFRITTRGAVEPSCPGCQKAAKEDLQEHACEDAAATFKMAREKCPFCEEKVRKKKAGPFCGGCGTQAKPTDIYCKQCGKPVGAAPAVTTPAPDVPRAPFISPGPSTPYTQPLATPDLTSRDTAPVPVQPLRVPAPSAPGRGPGAGSALLAVGAVLAVLGLIVIAALINRGTGTNTNFSRSSPELFTTKLNNALAANRIFAPCCTGNGDCDCAEGLWDAEKARASDSSALREAASMIRNKLEPEGTEALDRYYAESDPTINWGYISNLYKFLLKVAPNEPELRAKYAYSFGLVILNNKDYSNYPKAVSSFQDALRDKPDWVMAYNGLGRAYVQDEWSGRDGSKTIENYKKACELDPNFVWGCKNLGAYYAKEEVANYSLAEDYSEEALRRAPTRKSIWTQLKIICPKVGKRQNLETGFCE